MFTLLDSFWLLSLFFYCIKLSWCLRNSIFFMYFWYYCNWCAFHFLHSFIFLFFLSFRLFIISKFYLTFSRHIFHTLLSLHSLSVDYLISQIKLIIYLFFWRYSFTDNLFCKVGLIKEKTTPVCVLSASIPAPLPAYLSVQPYRKDNQWKNNAKKEERLSIKFEKLNSRQRENEVTIKCEKYVEKTSNKTSK